MSMNNYFVSDDQGIASASGSLESLENNSNITGRRLRSRSEDKTPLFRQIRLLGALSGMPNFRGQNPENLSIRHLTTFSGVFLPVSLSMFSAILFLRVGFILGHSGLLHTIVEMILAYSILIFTVLSICAISTNGAIEGGGAYFMISRALGPEFGGSIGALFFIANVLSSALYVTGCVEGLLTSFGPTGTVAQVLPVGKWWAFTYGSILNLFNMIVCFIGAALFAKTSIVVFATVMLCTLSVILSFLAQETFELPIPENNKLLNSSVDHLIFTGLSISTLKDNIYPHYEKDYTTNEYTSFAIVFGVLFSGVTGIMAGANMSGELKNPSKSIPLGTLGAVFFTFSTYILLFLLTASTTPGFVLRNNYLYMQYVDFMPELVSVGIFSATLFAAMSNLIGSSRVLEALAKDNLFGPILRPVVAFSTAGNPIFAVFVSGTIIESILLIGSLNIIAQITAVFFLLSYFATNLACVALTLTSAPNFRPLFRYFSWWTAVLGMLGCLIMMFIIDPFYAAFAFAMCLVLVIFLHLKSPPVRWGSISQALIFHQVRKYLLMLDSRKDHVKYWRPQFLLMVANPRSCVPLIRFANDLKKSGLYMLGHIKIGNIDDYPVDPVIDESHLWLKLLDKLKVKAFVEVTMCRTVREGLHQLARTSGLGAMKTNTILLGFYDDAQPIDFFALDEEYRQLENVTVRGNMFLSLRQANESKELNPDEYVCMIYDSILKLQKNVVLARNFHLLDKAKIKSRKMFIDIWPSNFLLSNESIYEIDNCWLFMMQLACILHMVPDWKHMTSMRVFLPSDTQVSGFDKITQQWRLMLQNLRIDANIIPVSTRFPFPIEKISDTASSVVEFQIRDSASENTLSFSDDGDNYTQRESNMRSLNNFQPSDEYLTSINRIIQEHCDNTAVVFLYLPLPNLSCNKKQYLQWLQMLSENLPPTLLVHGISPVTSTTL